MIPAIAMFAEKQLVHLSAVDVVIIAFYFVLVLAIGFYLRGRANTGEDFFMAGREMTAWVAGLSFLSANLGALELMGWAGSAYQYGILATHWYWIGAIPAMLFLALVMMPFYYISKTHSVPGYLKLAFRRTKPRSVGGFICLHDRAHERRQHVCHGQGHANRAGMGHQFQHLGLISDRRDLCNAGRAAFRNLQRSAAILPHLGGRTADSYPRACMRPAAGATSRCKLHREPRNSMSISGLAWARLPPIRWEFIGPASCLA